MTSPNARPAVSIEDVRARFLDAEKMLESAAGRLDQMGSTLEVLHASVDSVKGAGESINRAQRELAESVTLLRSACGAVAQAADDLGKSDPRELRAAIDGGTAQVLSRIESVVGATADARDQLERRIAEGLAVGGSIQGTVAELSAKSETGIERILSASRASVEVYSRQSRSIQRELRMFGVALVLLSVGLLIVTMLR